MRLSCISYDAVPMYSRVNSVGGRPVRAIAAGLTIGIVELAVPANMPLRDGDGAYGARMWGGHGAIVVDRDDFSDRIDRAAVVGWAIISPGGVTVRLFSDVGS